MQHRNTIIYICQFAGTPENGMNYRPYYLGKYAVKAGYRFIVIGAGYHHQMKTPKNLTRKPLKETIDGVEYIWMPSKKYRAGNYVERVLSLFAFPALLWNFDFQSVVLNDNLLSVVSSSPSLISSLPAIKWARKFKTKFVFEVRDIWPLSLVELSSVSERNPFIMFLKYIEKRSYKKADKVFTVLSNAKEYMMENGMSPEKFHYIPNGVDCLPGVSPENNTKSEIDKIFGSGFVIGYAGTVGVANNLSNLIAAARLLKDEKNIFFAVIGEGPKKEDIMNEASDLSNVIFLPSVPKKDINSWIKSFGAGYLGLKCGRMFEYGISPNKLFDYMLGKIPVLLTVNTTNSIVEQAGCGFVVTPDQPEELAEKIMILYKTDEKKRKQMGLNGYNYVSENHLYETIAKKFLDSVIKD